MVIFFNLLDVVSGVVSSDVLVVAVTVVGASVSSGSAVRETHECVREYMG